MSDLALCIHGHFYQPPREDPLTGIIPVEPGASPYSNWNEKIFSECYQPNIDLSNLEKISFNFGPTLMSWIAEQHPQTLSHIIAQDYANLRRNGVGNAMAQAYNHTILPLASQRDKITQVYWGIRDFETRYGRRPRGLWLPETAVDTETLMVLADFGIEYTILAPWQAHSINLDPTEPYWVSLPGKRRIVVFFYQQDLSGRVSFDPTTTANADQFAREELYPRFNPAKFRRGEPQMLLIASDGELYGHHKSYRDRFLQHLTNGASHQLGIETTYPALWLRDNPPRHTIAVNYNTSWSCYHGVNRWLSGCDCTPGYSGWKGALRNGLNNLAAALDAVYYEFMQQYTVEPWDMRNRFIDVILKRKSAAAVINECAAVPLDDAKLREIHWLLEAQYERQRMFTSCGWFFEDLNRIEPRNNIAYAAQAVWMTYLATGYDLSKQAAGWLYHAVAQDGQTRADAIFTNHLARAQNSNQVIPAR